MIKVQVVLCCSGVTISSDIEMPSVPRINETMLMELQTSKVKAVTWRLDTSQVIVHADLTEWGGCPCITDKQRWVGFRQIFPVPKWDWQGIFPDSLVQVCRSEMEKASS